METDSNNEQYPVSDFIAPTDILTQLGDLSNGYLVEIYSKNNELISPDYYTFDYYNGVLTFNPDVTKLMFKKWGGKFKLTGFRYIGPYVSDCISKLHKTIEDAEADLTKYINEAKHSLGELITANKKYIEELQNESLAIRKVKFDISNMTKISEETLDGETYLTYEIKIDHYCWDVKCNSTSIMTDIETVCTDDKWTSTITIEVLSATEDKLKEFNFEAITFVKYSGESIPEITAIDLTK